MGMKPAAALKVSKSKHGLAFEGPVHQNVLMDGKPALKIGALTKKHPPPGKKKPKAPDIVMEGVKNVKINGMPAVVKDSKAKHPGAGETKVANGIENILIG
jgi:uncharacterized Zn-binding protein involved in type VI secretion